MSEVVQKQDNDLDNMEEFKAGNDKFAFYDHFSKFSGLAVAQLYLVCVFDGGTTARENHRTIKET